MPIIEVCDLQKQYPLPDDKSQKFFAVNGVSLSIEQGEVFGILGPNGAGKTTTLEMIEGLNDICLLYTSPSPRDGLLSRMPSSA